MFARRSRSTATCSASATDLVPLASSILLGLFHFGVQSRAAFRTSPERLQQLWEPNADLRDHGRAGPARLAQIVEDRQLMPLVCDPLRISQMDLGAGRLAMREGGDTADWKEFTQDPFSRYLVTLQGEP